MKLFLYEVLRLAWQCLLIGLVFVALDLILLAIFGGSSS